MRYTLVSVFLIILSYFGILTFFTSLSSRILFLPSSLLRGFAIDIKETKEFYSQLRTINSKNKLLVQENLQLKSQISDLNHLKEENDLLKEQLKIKSKSTKDRNLLVADVLGNPLDLTGSSLYINRGSRDGVSEGNSVILGNNLLGMVLSVQESKSLVSLITSPNVTMSAVDTTSTGKTEGVVTGRFGTSVAFTKILPNEDIRVGDIIVTSGKDGLFTRDLVIGAVANISGGISEPLRTAELKPLVDFRRIERVFIII